MTIIIYPTHKKFINLLRKINNKGTPLILKKEDVNEIYKILSEDNYYSIQKHQRVYKVFLRSIYTNKYEKGDIIIDNSKIKNIKEFLSKNRKKIFFKDT